MIKRESVIARNAREKLINRCCRPPEHIFPTPPPSISTLELTRHISLVPVLTTDHCELRVLHRFNSIFKDFYPSKNLKDYSTFRSPSATQKFHTASHVRMILRVLEISHGSCHCVNRPQPKIGRTTQELL